MKKAIAALLLTVSMLSAAGCGNKAKDNNTAENTAEAASKKEENSSGETENSGKIEVDKKLFDITVTIPANLAGDISDDEIAEVSEQDGVKSVTKNEDGSITYVMSKARHKQIMEEMKTNMDAALQDMVESGEYPSYSAISANDDFTEIKVTTNSDQLNLKESLSVITLYMYGGMFNAFNGTPVDNVHVEFINEKSGEVVGRFDSRNMAANNTAEQSEEADIKPLNLDDAVCNIINNTYSSSATYAVQISNPNPDHAILYPVIVVTIKDAENRILKNEEQTLNSIAAGDTIYYGNSIYMDNIADAASYEINVETNNYRKQDDSQYARTSDFVIENTNLIEGSYDNRITGEITNTGSVDTYMTAVSIIFKKNGKMIGGTTSYVDHVSPGTKKVFEISFTKSFDFDDYEVHAIQW